MWKLHFEALTAVLRKKWRKQTPLKLGVYFQICFEIQKLPKNNNFWESSYSDKKNLSYGTLDSQFSSACFSLDNRFWNFFLA